MQQLFIVASASAELVDRRHRDRKVVSPEGECARRWKLRRLLNQPAVVQPEKDDLRIVGREESARFGGRGDAFARSIVDLDENPTELRAPLLAAVDPQCQPPSQLIELGDPDRCAQRPRPQVEAQPLVAIIGIGLDIADDHGIERHQPECVHVGYAKQAAEADADPAKRVEFGRQSELAEGEQDAEQQPDWDSERKIFRKQVGEHLPDDADRPAGVDDEVEQPEHLVEHQQHRGQHQRPDERDGDGPREIAID
jgi:hypothetical protein